MKSFIRYLYEYQNGKRTRNTGFVKVLEQTDTAEIQIYDFIQEIKKLGPGSRELLIEENLGGSASLFIHPV